MATQTQSPSPIGEARPLPPHPLTYDEFLEWAEDGSFVEWVDGKVEFMSPVSLPHTDIGVFLSRLLAEYAELHGGGRVLTAPFQMKLSNVKRGREPDLMFVAKSEMARLTHTYLDGPATIAVEIVSPESRLHAPSADGVYHSTALPGIWMRTQWLWQDPLPTMRQVRSEWGIA